MQITGEIEHGRSQWVVYKEKIYIDNEGKKKGWTYIERILKQEAVVIIPVTEETGSIILISQFRVPFEQDIVEFPAGLIDHGESIEEAAHRELLEETGYTGKIVDISPALSTSAGMTNETVYIVKMLVGENPSKASAHESSEKIKIHKIRRDEISSAMKEWKNDSAVLDSKVYTYLTDDQ